MSGRTPVNGRLGTQLQGTLCYTVLLGNDQWLLRSQEGRKRNSCMVATHLPISHHWSRVSPWQKNVAVSTTDAIGTCTRFSQTLSHTYLDPLCKQGMKVQESEVVWGIQFGTDDENKSKQPAWGWGRGWREIIMIRMVLYYIYIVS